MSGTYIPNFEPSKEGYISAIYPDGTVVKPKNEEPFYEIYKAIPVPEHGRLIDADELAQQYVTAQEQREKDKTDYCNAFMNNGEPCTEWWCVEDMLENAPTIIPADKEGEE